MRRSSPRHSAPSPEPTFTADDIIAALQATVASARDSDGVAVSDVAKVTRWPESRVSKLMRRAVLTGTARCTGRAYRPAMDGTMRPVPVYAVVRAA